MHCLRCVLISYYHEIVEQYFYKVQDFLNRLKNENVLQGIITDTKYYIFNLFVRLCKMNNCE
jgi:hypothetical protein